MIILHPWDRRDDQKRETKWRPDLKFAGDDVLPQMMHVWDETTVAFALDKAFIDEVREE